MDGKFDMVPFILEKSSHLTVWKSFFPAFSLVTIKKNSSHVFPSMEQPGNTRQHICGKGSLNKKPGCINIQVLIEKRLMFLMPVHEVSGMLTE